MFRGRSAPKFSGAVFPVSCLKVQRREQKRMLEVAYNTCRRPFAFSVGGLLAVRNGCTYAQKAFAAKTSFLSFFLFVLEAS